MPSRPEKTPRATIPEILGQQGPSVTAVLTPEAVRFLGLLHERFEARRQNLLAARRVRQKAFDAGALPDFLPETKAVREDASWKVTPPPADLQDRRVEITGPVERKMMINALNSGAKCFLADFEDSLSPTWENVIEGQVNCRDAVRGMLRLETPEKTYELKKDGLAALLVRPRGWHLPEKHVTVDGAPLSAALFDFGLYAFHNLAERVKRGSGLYLYLPKMESHLEARLWNEAFELAEDHLGVPCGSIRATVLIETLPAAFEMEEILYELRDHSLGLNAGRWDYIFSAIKKFAKRGDFILPDRAAVSMTVPFMKAYTDLLVKTCHKRGAFAMGGMSAFVPSRKDQAINEKAFAAVRADKQREATNGFDGTWVAHPDLVPVAMEQFGAVLKDAPNQIARQRPEVSAAAADLLAMGKTPGAVTPAGIRNNINVALQYIAYWLAGTGAAAIHNLMEDAATAEISRAQLWQWRVHGVEIEGGGVFDAALYETIRDEELAGLSGSGLAKLKEAAALLDLLVLSEDFGEFLTLPAYEQLT